MKNSIEARKYNKPWLKVRLANVNPINKSSNGLKDLHTVCESALCPNRGECFSNGIATFLVLGDICTRGCSFCAVSKGNPLSVDFNEPKRVAEAVKKLNLKHVVVTSVTRDDLSDGGASIFVHTVNEVCNTNPECSVELLIPDFQGKPGPLKKVMDSLPDILCHNIETVKSKYRAIRTGADYHRSLKILENIKEYNNKIVAKSGLMLGIGEEKSELIATIKDIRNTGCDMLTLGQYLQPKKDKTPVKRYLHPEEFEELKQISLDLGFLHVNSGPLVRSSYHASDYLDPPPSFEVSRSY